MSEIIDAKEAWSIAIEAESKRDMDDILDVMTEIRKQALRGRFCAEFDSLNEKTRKLLELNGFEIKEGILFKNISVHWEIKEAREALFGKQNKC